MKSFRSCLLAALMALSCLATPLRAYVDVYFTSLPANVGHDESYYVEAAAYFDDFYSEVTIWKSGGYFTSGGGWGSASAGASTSDSGPQTVNYVAECYDAWEWWSDYDYGSVTVGGPGGPPNQPPTATIEVDGYGSGATITRPYGGSVAVTVRYKATDPDGNLSGIRPQIWSPDGNLNNNGGAFIGQSGGNGEVAWTVTLDQNGSWYFWTDATDSVISPDYTDSGSWGSGFQLYVQEGTPPNTPPTVSVWGSTSATTAGQTIQLYVRGQDPDGNARYFNLDQNSPLAGHYGPGDYFSASSTPNNGAWDLGYETGDFTRTVNMIFPVAGDYVFRGAVYDVSGWHYSESTFTVTVVPPNGNGTGLTGAYYHGANFNTNALTRVDSTVDFAWGGGSPDPTVAADQFSVRWNGQVQPRYSQTYTFITTSDDGVRLWVNGQLLIDDWTDHGDTERSGSIALAAGQKYDIQMEYYENVGGATAKLAWESASQAREIIPASQLYPSGGATGYPPVITSATAVTQEAGVAFYYQIVATNGPTGYSATNLPTGLSFNPATGQITGTPMAVGTHSIGLGATNAVGTGTATLVLTVGTQHAGSNFFTAQSGTAPTWGHWTTPFLNWALNDINTSSAPDPVKAQALQVLNQITAAINLTTSYNSSVPRTYSVGIVTGEAVFSREPDDISYHVEFSITWRDSLMPVTFTFGNLSHSYDGTAKTATVTPSPDNATFTHDLTRGPAAGSYTVTATATGVYTGTGTATLTIGSGGQTIDFPQPGTQTVGTPLTLQATASSGLPVTFTVVSGTATLTGNTASFTVAGFVTIKASQPGNGNIGPAPDVLRTFLVTSGNPELDTDGDGVSDDIEAALNLNPRIPGDVNVYFFTYDRINQLKTGPGGQYTTDAEGNIKQVTP